jgi:nucleoside-diphosphate-sugar epimerase
MGRAVILGGTGAIGWATARRLLAAGWDVLVTGRDPTAVPAGLVAAGGEFVIADRTDTGSLATVVADGADLLVDCVCYTAAEALQLSAVLEGVSCAVMISSKAVYVDTAGRHTNSEEPPRFSGPVREDNRTLRPNTAPYDSPAGYGANKVAAEEVLLDSGYPVTILRPSKVHGAFSRRPREWVFVKRILDHRPAVLLARGGTGADHPSAAVNIAALIDVVARQPGQRILNIADPDCPNGLAIARTVAGYLNYQWDEILLDNSGKPGLGTHPWDTVPPIVLDTAAATSLGYKPEGRYSVTVADELDWLVAAAKDGPLGHRLPADDDDYFSAMLDYAAEDQYLAEQHA